MKLCAFALELVRVLVRFLFFFFLGTKENVSEKLVLTEM